MMGKLSRIGVLGATMALSVSAAAGQPPKPAATPSKAERKLEKGKGRPDRDQLREEIIDRYRAERMWKLTDALKLDEATAAKVFPLLSKYDDQERTVAHERADTYRELKDALDAPNPDSKRIEGLVQRLIALRGRRQAIGGEKLQALRKVLSPLQMGKLMLVTPRIEEGFRERIREALDQARAEDGHRKPK
jgi:Spy/CpxP family protein refolding chaperone